MRPSHLVITRCLGGRRVSTVTYVGLAHVDLRELQQHASTGEPRVDRHHACDGHDAFSRAGAPLPAGLPPLYETALRVVARDALLLRDGVL